MRTRVNIVALIFSMATVLASPVVAQGQAPEKKRGDANAEHGRPHEPPPQAYVNCKDKKEGDKVQIVTPHDEKMSATCTASANGLFARPERPPHRKMDAENQQHEKK